MRYATAILAGASVLALSSASKAADGEAPAGASGPAEQIASPAVEGLTGDWGGVRTRLNARGFTFQGGYSSESAFNIQGGSKRRIEEAGQLGLSATADLEKAAGLPGGVFQIAITGRRGRDLGQVANLGVLQQVQEIYGRGQTWRLTQFWYEQRFGPVRLKVGRSSPGEDFAAFSCTFENLSLCGSPPGNIVGDYWYNWPIGQWSARLRVDRDQFYAEAGAYEVNPKNLRNAFSIGRVNGATGVLAPVEIGWIRKGSGLAASYKLGGWYTSADALDLDQPTSLAGPSANISRPRRSDRYGAWFQVERQVSGSARDGIAQSGASVFFNFTQADRQTSHIDQQASVGLIYRAPFQSRPGDVLGLGLARTQVNSRGLPAGPHEGSARAEYAAEAYYRFRPRPWLALSPNLQWVEHPGGRSDRRSVVVAGFSASLAL